MAKVNIQNARKEYLDKLTPEERQITLALWKQKAQEARTEKKEMNDKIQSLADITRKLGEAEYLVFDDDEPSQTINEKCVAVAYANFIRNPKSSFKDINDMQKVIKDDTEDNKTAVTVNFITNGQDLGE